MRLSEKGDIMKILITGSNGFLGSNLVRFFSAKQEYEVHKTSQHPSYFPEWSNFIVGDLLDEAFVDSLFSDIKPDLVINTVSLANVDLCEEDPELAYELTVRTAKNVAQAAKRNGSRLIYISTDHLFEGDKPMYSEDDMPAPVNVYGKMKVEAELISRQIHSNTVIVRTNFFGWSHSYHTQTFGEWLYNSLNKKIPINLYTDYYFTPIEVTYLAEALESLALSDFTGIINVAGSQRCSKYEFGITMSEIFSLDPSVIHSGKIEINTFRAKRQKDLSLSTEKFRRIFGRKLPDIRESLKKFYDTRPMELTY